MIDEEPLTTRQAAKLLGYKALETMRDKIKKGIFRIGEHFDKPEGSQLKWRKSALLAYRYGAAPVVEETFQLATPGGRKAA